MSKQRLVYSWIRRISVCHVTQNSSNQNLADAPMPKRPSVGRVAPAGTKKAKRNSAPFSISNKFDYRPDPSLAGTSTPLTTPEKSANDKKDYRAIRLKNGLTVLLISDASYPLEKLDEEEAHLAEDDGSEDEDDEDDEEGEEEEEEDDEDDDAEEEDEANDRPSLRKKTDVTGLKMSAASLCVHIGSFSDPEDVPGMAHFLEHMVFMGTEKYPDENSFDVFNRKHGGFDNASTDCETTQFYFEVPRKHFLEGLDRFSQFFISPLMKEDSMQREREAVDSEFEMGLPDDYNRMAQIYGGIAEGHPMSKFMWGNTKSLSPAGLSDAEIHRQLHEFRRRHYSAQFMTLAVQSQHTLDIMQEWIENIFSLVPNNGLELETFGHLSQPFHNPRHHRLYRVNPVQNIYQVDLTWSLPPLLDKYRTKPLHYVAYLLGHEGKGSLLSYLRRKVWALSLTAGSAGDGFEFNSCNSMFTVTVGLTKAGYEELESVLRAVFSYLAMMQREGHSSRTFKEIQEIERLGFMYSEERQPSENVESISENMQFFPPERFLDGDDLIFEDDPALIKSCVDALVFDDVNIFVKSREIPEAELDLTESWFGTKYAETSIPVSWEAACRAPDLAEEFHLPEPNLFIPEDLSIRAPDVEQTKHPVRLVEDRVGELFYKKDNVFLQPRAYILYHLRSPRPLQSLEKSILLDLTVNCLAQLMVEDVYPADLAQLSYSVYSVETGLVIKISGLSDKLPRLMDTILKHLCALPENIGETLFQAVVDQQRKDYYNHAIKPNKLVKDIRLSVLQDVYWSPHEKHNHVRSCRLDQLRDFIRAFLQNVYIQALIQGNLTSAEAKELDAKVRRTLETQPLAPDTVTEIRCREVLLGNHLFQVEGFNSGDANTLVTNYYQAGPGSVRKHTILQVITMLMEEPVFDCLRTQEQLGYTVYNTLRNTHGVLGFSITVNTQATKYSSEHVESRIECFLKMFLENHLHEEKVSFAVNSLSKLKVRADVTLVEEVNRNWSEIMSREYNFNRHEKEIMVLSTLSVSDVVDYFQPLLPGGDACRKMSVHVIGSKDGTGDKDGGDDKIFELNLIKDKENCVHDLHEFRQKLKTHPVIYIVE